MWGAGTSGMKGRNKHIMNKKRTTEEGAPPRRRNGSAEALGPTSEIGRKLKQYFDELVSDEVPDRFAQLLRQLEKSEPAQEKD